jgi:hypothetical protein
LINQVIAKVGQNVGCKEHHFQKENLNVFGQFGFVK